MNSLKKTFNKIVKKSLQWKLILVFHLFSFPAIPQQTTIADFHEIHELTVYVIPSAKPLDWSSPKTLYKSYLNSYISRIFSKNKKSMGHLFVKFTSTHLHEPLYCGMINKNPKEQKQYFLKDKIGLSVLGAPQSGEIECREDLKSTLDYFGRKNKLAFITYHINDISAQRIMEFYTAFTTKFNENHAPCDFYGGAFWPRYEYEGAGCTAFGLALMDVAGILNEESKNWLVEVNLPKKLIGGEFNDNQKIKKREIKKAEVWTESSDSLKNFIHFSIYDPSLIYNWILEQRNLSSEMREPGYLLFDEGNIPGLKANKSHIKIDKTEPILKKRSQHNIFIQNYYTKIGIN